MTSWAILTGEYPPKLGGVADYTRLVARGLAAAGDEVDVFTTPSSDAAPHDDGVRVHAVEGGWGPRGLAFVGRALASRPPTRVLVQYVAQAFGMRGVNLPFVAWVAARREPVWIMFHEVAWPIQRGDPLRRNVLGVVTHGMAGLLAGRAQRSFVSIPEWNEWIRRGNPLAREAQWLPVPSTIATEVSADAVAAVRARHEIGPRDVVVGYFGTIGFTVAPYLEGALERLGADGSRVLVVLGPRGPELAARLRTNPRVRARVVAPGALPADEVAAYVKACDALVIPHFDGVSTRRTAVMAGLALGVAVVTNTGVLTHDVWRDGAVALAPSPAPDDIVAAAEPLLRDPAKRADVARRGLALYRARFSLERTVEALRAPGARGAS